MVMALRLCSPLDSFLGRALIISGQTLTYSGFQFFEKARRLEKN